MAADERGSNLYLYGCTAKLLPLVAARRNAPFGCETAVMTNFGLYLTDVVSAVGTAARPIAGKAGSPHRTLPQVHHCHEERIP